MSPRPRSASDAEIFAALTRVIGRVGPGRMTLADVAAEVGITAGALVQRFGSKRDLLLAVSRASAEGVREEVAAVRAAHDSPLAALHAFTASTARRFDTPEEMAHHLAFLQLDLADPEFRALALAYFRAEREGVKALLDKAFVRRELSGEGDTSRLAEAVQATVNGTRLLWAVMQNGTLEERTREALEVLLGPWRKV